MEDLERKRREYDDPEARKKYAQRVGRSNIDMLTPKAMWNTFEIFAETYDICSVCNYSNRSRFMQAKAWQKYKGLVAQYCGENGIEEPDIQNNSNNFCDNCGNTLKPTSKFCAKCGTRID